MATRPLPVSNGSSIMTITTLSSREFDQDTSQTKNAATAGPVFITDRGVPARAAQHRRLSTTPWRAQRHHRQAGNAAGCGRRGTQASAEARSRLVGRLLLMFLLDTNVISELRKARAGKANPSMTAWAQTVPIGSFFLSAIVIQELEIGVLLAEHRYPAKGAILRSWLDDHVLLSSCEHVLPVDTVVARRNAALHVPDLRPGRDG